MSERARHVVRYRLPEPSYLTDADERRYVRITPAPGGVEIDYGDLIAGEAPSFRAVGAFAFDPVDVPAAVQRFIALAADWLGFDEFEIEQARALFAAGK